MARLVMDKVCCDLDGHRTFEALSLQLEEGEIAALLGPSGCGKTTALRAIAGFQPVIRGSIHIAGRQVSAPGFSVPPEQRAVGLVFQDFALFPHLTVGENIAMGIRKLSGVRQRQIVREMLKMTDLESDGTSGAMEHRYPHQLSGGQQARVALARAMAPRPSLLLLDEPFAGLDLALRERLLLEVRNILRETDSTALLVTHHQLEAFALGDRVGVMRDGEILQMDTPFNLFHQPASRKIAAFVDRGLFLLATLRSPHHFETELGAVHSEQPYDHPPGTRMEILLRRNDVLVDSQGPIVGTVTDKAFQGDATLYTLQLESGILLQAVTSSHNDKDIGEKVRLRLDLEHVVAFPILEEDPE